MEITQQFVCTNTSDALAGEFGYSSVLSLAGMPKLVGTSTDVSSAAAQAWLDVELGLPGPPGNLPRPMTF